jgi:hypothetical protein
MGSRSYIISAASNRGSAKSCGAAASRRPDAGAHGPPAAGPVAGAACCRPTGRWGRRMPNLDSLLHDQPQASRRAYRRRCARSHPAPLVTLCSDSRLHGPMLRESFPDGRDGRRPTRQASAGSSRPLCLRHERTLCSTPCLAAVIVWAKRVVGLLRGHQEAVTEL